MNGTSTVPVFAKWMNFPITSSYSGKADKKSDDPVITW